jgi:hypothetical protein
MQWFELNPYPVRVVDYRQPAIGRAVRLILEVVAIAELEAAYQSLHNIPRCQTHNVPLVIAMIAMDIRKVHAMTMPNDITVTVAYMTFSVRFSVRFIVPTPLTSTVICMVASLKAALILQSQFNSFYSGFDLSAVHVVALHEVKAVKQSAQHILLVAAHSANSFDFWVKV